MVDVEHDHLGRAARLAARLDRAGPGVGAAHEGDRPGRGAALGQRLHRPADVRQVDPGAGPAAEDLALLGVPVEDRLHRVVDGEDEAGRALRLLLEPDVEPHGRVERRELVEQDVRQLGLERVAVLDGREVAALAAPVGDRPGHAGDHLLDRALARRRVQLPAEVLLGDDVRRVLRPRRRELDVLLLEDACRSSRRGSPSRRRRTGCTPGWVNRRRTLSASPARVSVLTAVCGVCCSMSVSSFQDCPPGGPGATARRVCGLGSVRLGPDGIAREALGPSRTFGGLPPDADPVGEVAPGAAGAERRLAPGPADAGEPRVGPAEPAERRVGEGQQRDAARRARRARAGRPAGGRPRSRRRAPAARPTARRASPGAGVVAGGTGRDLGVRAASRPPAPGADRCRRRRRRRRRRAGAA